MCGRRRFDFCWLLWVLSFVWNLVHHCQLLKDTLPLFIRGSALSLFRET